jgi:outer membrane protein assembly factor BamB
MNTRTGILWAATLVVVLSPCQLIIPASCRAADWYRWRGPWQNGVSPETDLPATFSPLKVGANNLIWETPYGCRSTPLVLNGKVFINGSAGDGITSQERVVCLDEKTGKKLWEHRFNMFHSDIVMARVGWTNLAADPETGNVYCHGTQGLLICFDPNGKILWERSLTEEVGRISGYGGRLPSPVVDSGLVIVNVLCANWGEYARGGTRLVALDKNTGKVAWWASTGYRVRNSHASSPTIAVINGERLLIVGGGEGGLHAFQVHTGKKVWSYLFAGGSINSSPVVEGTRVYVGHGEVNLDSAQQGRVICVDAGVVKDGKPKLVWQVNGLKIKFSSPVLYKGRLYLNDEGAELHCLDAKTGKEFWRYKFGRGSNNRCSPVWADGKLYVSDASSNFYILEPGEMRCKRLHRQFFRSRTPGVDAELDGCPAVANGRVFFSTNEATFCIGKPNAKAAPPVPDPIGKAPAGMGKPAQLVVSPAQITLPPGGSATFTAKLYDEKGNFLRDVKPKWSLGGMKAPEVSIGLPPPPKISPPPLKGEITAGGKLTVPATLQGQFGAVVAEADGVTGRARVRQVCKLPYGQDFEKIPAGRTPGGWVNTQGKFAVRKEGNSNVLVKLARNPSPLVARGRAYIGTPDMTNYTIEADVLGKKFQTDMADVGIINSRYMLFLVGNLQQLRLTSWNALPRVDKTITFPWKPDTWYHLKLNVQVNGDKAVVRGKIWERGKPEPQKWTLEADDPAPNKTGAPGLYANATGIPPNGIGAEAYFDNVAITPNNQKK